MRDSRHHCVGAARPDRSLVCRTWVDAFLIFNFYLGFILWFHIIAWLFINSSRSINHVIYDLLWFMLFMMPPPAASLLPGALVPPGAPGHPIPAAGARCLLPSSRQERGLAALPWWLMPQPFLQLLPPPASWTTFALKKLFSQQWTCARRAVASLLVRSWWQVS